MSAAWRALVRAKYPDLSAPSDSPSPPDGTQSAAGVDNQVGYGVVDPVAALTFSVPQVTGWLQEH